MSPRSGINNAGAVLVHYFETIEIIILIFCVVHLTTPEKKDFIKTPLCTVYGCGCNNF